MWMRGAEQTVFLQSQIHYGVWGGNTGWTDRLWTSHLVGSLNMLRKSWKAEWNWGELQPKKKKICEKLRKLHCLGGEKRIKSEWVSKLQIFFPSPNPVSYFKMGYNFGVGRVCQVQRPSESVVFSGHGGNETPWPHSHTFQRHPSSLHFLLLLSLPGF